MQDEIYLVNLDLVCMAAKDIDKLGSCVCIGWQAKYYHRKVSAHWEFVDSFNFFLIS